MIVRTSWTLLGLASLAVGQSDLQDRLQKALRAQAREVRLADDGLSGPGADFLVAEAKKARFTLLGESHGNRR